jgi:hypothetical protein
VRLFPRTDRKEKRTKAQHLIVEGSEKAVVVEEAIGENAQVAEVADEEIEIEKTPSAFDLKKAHPPLAHQSRSGHSLSMT